MTCGGHSFFRSEPVPSKQRDIDQGVDSFVESEILTDALLFAYGTDSDIISYSSSRGVSLQWGVMGQQID